jgi:hypothetical protein
MRTYFNSAALIAICNALVTLVLYMSGFHTDPAKFNSGTYIFLSISLILSLVIIVRSVRARKALTPPTDPFPFGLAMGMAITISFLASIFWAVFQLIYLGFINPNFTHLVMELKLAAMQSQGATAAEIETSRQSMHPSLNPGVYAAAEFLLSMTLNTVLSLIIALTMRRKAVEETPAISPMP